MATQDILNTIKAGITNMFNKLQYGGGSSETHWAYYDWRNDMFNLFKEGKDNKIEATDEEALALGKAIIEAYNENLKIY